MKGVTLPIRKAFKYNISDGLLWQNQVVPVSEEVLNGPPAVILYNNQSVQLYVILLNQTSNNNSRAKCLREDQSTIQVQVVTSWPSGSGGSELAETIGDIIKGHLFQGVQYNASIELDGLNLMSCTFEGATNIHYDTAVSRVFIHQMTFLLHVEQ